MTDTLCDYAKFRIIRRHPEVGQGNVIAMHPERVKVGGLVTFDLTSDVTLEDWVEISDGVQIFTHKHHWRHSRGLRAQIQRVTPHPLRICEDAFIGVSAIILGGVHAIGRGAVVGAGSVVTKLVGPYEIVAGNPARMIGMRAEDEIGGPK